MSGNTYEFSIFKIGVGFNPNQLGNCIYAKISADNQWVPIYIGEGELSERCDLAKHHKGQCIADNEATHFLRHLNKDKATRLAEESDLLASYSAAYMPTVCNEKIGG